MSRACRRMLAVLALTAGLGWREVVPAEPSPPAPPEVQRVLCLLSEEEEPYTGIRDAFFEQLREQGHKIRRGDYVVRAGEKIPEDRLWIEGGGVDLIFAVGTRAAVAARDATKTIPVVYTLVLNPEKAGLTGVDNVCGVSIRVPFPRLLAAVHEGLPEVRDFAVLHRRDEARGDFLKFQKSPPEGFRIRFIPVTDAKDVPDALEKVEGTQAILSFPDSVVYSQSALTHIQTFCLNRRIYLIGFSVPMTEGGSVLSVGADFPKLGTQCAVQGGSILAGKAKPAALGLEDPVQLEISVNQPVARRMGHRFPEEFLGKVKRRIP